jgi:hypothetical protein
LELARGRGTRLAGRALSGSEEVEGAVVAADRDAFALGSGLDMVVRCRSSRQGLKSPCRRGRREEGDDGPAGAGRGRGFVGGERRMTAERVDDERDDERPMAEGRRRGHRLGVAMVI